MQIDLVKKGGPSLMREDKANEVINGLNSLFLLKGSPSQLAIKLEVSSDGSAAILHLPVIKSVVCFEDAEGNIVQKKALIIGVYDGEVPPEEEE
jgi:hypothetical protein